MQLKSYHKNNSSQDFTPTPFPRTPMRWKPGSPVPKGISPDPYMALARHAHAAEIAEREQLEKRSAA